MYGDLVHVGDVRFRDVLKVMVFGNILSYF